MRNYFGKLAFAPAALGWRLVPPVRHRSVANGLQTGTLANLGSLAVSEHSRNRSWPDETGHRSTGVDIQTPSWSDAPFGEIVAPFGAVRLAVLVRSRTIRESSSPSGLTQTQRSERATIHDASNGPCARCGAFAVWIKPQGAGIAPNAAQSTPYGASVHVLMQAAWTIVSTAPRSGSETGYAASRSLRAVHRWQRRCAKRPDNVPPPRRLGPREGSGGVCQLQGGRGARLASTVNVCEWLSKRRYPDQAEVAITLGPKWYVVGFTPLHWVNAATTTIGGKATPNLALLFKWNSVSPSLCPLGGREAVRRPVAVAGRGRWRKRMTRCNGAYTGMKHVRQGNLCPLPPGRSLRDDLIQPIKGAHIGASRHGHPRRRGRNTRPLRGDELECLSSTGGQRERARLRACPRSPAGTTNVSFGTTGKHREGTAVLGSQCWLCQRGFAAA